MGVCAPPSRHCMYKDESEAEKTHSDFETKTVTVHFVGFLESANGGSQHSSCICPGLKATNYLENCFSTFQSQQLKNRKFQREGDSNRGCRGCAALGRRPGQGRWGKDAKGWRGAVEPGASGKKSHAKARGCRGGIQTRPLQPFGPCAYMHRHKMADGPHFCISHPVGALGAGPVPKGLVYKLLKQFSIASILTNQNFQNMTMQQKFHTSSVPLVHP